MLPFRETNSWTRIVFDYLKPGGPFEWQEVRRSIEIRSIVQRFPDHRS